MTEIIQGTGVPKLVLGQKLYIPCHNQNIIVEAIIEELNDVYGGAKQTVWHNYNINGGSDATISTKTLDENGWNIAAPFPLEDLPKLKLLNQFPWTNFPTWGHAAYIGNDAFVTLQEARKWISASNKKHLVRRLKAATKWTRKEFPNYRLSEYKIYVK
jgi:hypothetical protein